MYYEGTSDEDIVNKITDREVDLAVLVGEYLRLRTEYLSRPQPKAVPDQETLDYYNADIEVENAGLLGEIQALYYKLKPIYDAGLLPSKYNDEYLQLENIATG